MTAQPDDLPVPEDEPKVVWPEAWKANHRAFADEVAQIAMRQMKPQHIKEGRALGRKEWEPYVEGAAKAAVTASAAILTEAHDKHLSELRHSYEHRAKAERNGARAFGGMVGIILGVIAGAGGAIFAYKDVQLTSAAARGMERREYTAPTAIVPRESYADDGPDLGSARPWREPAGAP